ncbi:5-carboxymethyl-2-hydroxymuconate Delta-isomerase [Pseudomonas sp. P1B16]|jgi:5-carboxymethyl-2-hydroxymuconate isomerase|uniref:5-carboxymethyl-2-hydroxymuconate Delta-isomerase n=1 Tax=Pseudomonas capeferrum TaxID=1495066 RepID=A0ABY7RG89_9PSED|nr:MULTISPECIES: 5-carboxymethyl-2-hydroxymuconate Delta-isomerase [Pseudomonas]KEY87744.1 5-carboxymethyl-2-hydroxymuconate isomerase [Pseudomonas capeferrum]KGI94335.1 5-carboxymethyl-2-hydroxymuconate isomerase [Pseudomonas sp. H2]MCH7302515.1 5-carboxymethyl-2-hydroxymuconate Delta-isomerase [Pseudomonas capeferrum]MDD2063046.1 5-carboxymethyl-2-hydroxymuconate Delta-isomerase [Pseudomonas sp. 25571]MDD2129847.1 5-carboxymethyl-2-hydroxymuconate Delta-isomerase [Pseudomonas sp. 17391]
MPHLVLLYTPDLEADADIPALCRALADTMLEQRDAAGKAVFPTGGTRVLAYPAAHCAVADGNGDYGFLYANLRMGSGRAAEVHKTVGDSLLQVLKQHLDGLLQQRPIGITVQIDESTAQVYDAKHSTLHPLFNTPA